MLVRDVMSTQALRVAPEVSMEEAARQFAASEGSELFVTDATDQLVGVLAEGDLIRAVLPNLQEIHDAGGSVNHAKDAFIRKGQLLAQRSVAAYIISNPLSVSPTDHLAVAAAALIDSQIRRLPVVEDGRLLGTVSRSDIVRGVLRAGTLA